MRLIAQGETEALNQLMLRWQSRLYAFVWRSVRSREVAEELAQETFWRLWDARARYRPGGRFPPWLFQIASRLCIDHFRRVGARPRLVSEEDFPQPQAREADRPDRAARFHEAADAVDAAIADLPENQRIALELIRFEDLTYREAAKAMETTPGAVEQLVHRARKRLRRDLAEFLPAAGPAAGPAVGADAGAHAGPGPDPGFAPAAPNKKVAEG